MRGVAACLLLIACAKAGTDPSTPVDGATVSDDGGLRATACPAGEFATDISPSGVVSCAPIASSIASAVGDHCSAYLGWRDNCDGCALPPTKFGTSGKACTTGGGAGNTCLTHTLNATPVSLFGLDLDGDMDGNDKLYAGMHCTAGASLAGIAPCGPGQVIDGLLGSSWSCVSIADVAIDYVRSSCSLYLGWQDNCDNCTTAPVKWGRSGDASCTNGAGADNTCITATLAGETVNLFGLNPDGDVDGNDKLHVGLDCLPAEPAMTTSTTTCPAGQFVTATDTDGSFRCESIAPLVADFFATSCTLTFGWQDNCNGCATPPTKFGSVRVGNCTLGAGADDTCNAFTLGGRSVNMFGLNTDGNVDGNDTLYVGFRCQ